MSSAKHTIPVRTLLVLLALIGSIVPSQAQDRLKKVPGYERYQDLSTNEKTPYRSNLIHPQWKDGGKAFEYVLDKTRYRYDLSSLKSEVIGQVEKKPRPETSSRTHKTPQIPKRGRQFTSAVSPDKKWVAFYKERNVWLKPHPQPADTKEKNEKEGDTEQQKKEVSNDADTQAIAVTTEGNAEKRIKVGTASWVYGEELKQKTALWWSPDSKRLAFYRFDESSVKDYYLTLDHKLIQNQVLIEPYPKPGTPNPLVDVLVYDLESKATVRIKVRDGKPFADDLVGHYIYNVSWTPDGKELLFHRTNRWQNVMEICAADPITGDARVVVREEWLPSWTENSPTMKFLKDGKRFVLASERTGWRNYYLYDLTGKLITPLTSHKFDCAEIYRIDEEQNTFYYMAHSGENHMLLQLHRVGLEGQNDTRLTYPAFHHSVNVSPDGEYILDTAQTHAIPPTTRLLDKDGHVLATVSTSDLTRFRNLGLQEVELFEFKAADGETTLHGILHKPSNFDPSRKYPLLVYVYAGPATARASERFRIPNYLTEFGFLVAEFDSRSVGGRGKRILDSIYQKLGTVEIDDQAAGVKFLRERPYVDGSRVGIYGISYGGYASLMCLLRYPDVFHAACASSPPTDWRNYDTIYTERYMRTPEVNKAGYDAGNVLEYADKLQGRLMLFFGTADDNVHPSNSLQLIEKFQKAGKSIEVQIGPDAGHSGIPNLRMMEFFVENLVMPLSGPASVPDTRSRESGQ